MKIHIHFKSGYELIVSCKKFTYERDRVTGEITQYRFIDVTDNQPIDFDLEEVDCVYREVKNDKSPCDLCRYNPPSSGDDKPCSMCPAYSGGNE